MTNEKPRNPNYSTGAHTRWSDPDYHVKISASRQITHTTPEFREHAAEIISGKRWVHDPTTMTRRQVTHDDAALLLASGWASGKGKTGPSGPSGPRGPLSDEHRVKLAEAARTERSRPDAKPRGTAGRTVVHHPASGEMRFAKAAELDMLMSSGWAKGRPLTPTAKAA